MILLLLLRLLLGRGSLLRLLILLGSVLLRGAGLRGLMLSRLVGLMTLLMLPLLLL